MIIKENLSKYLILRKLINRIKRIKFRFYTILILLLVIIAIVGIGGIYYGTKLNESENSSVFSSFYRFFRPSLNIISHSYKGLVAKPEKLYIHIKHLDYQKLAYRVKNARKRRIITREEKEEEVNAFIELNGQKYDINIKLKGVFLDQLRGDKWSFRIKVNDDKTIFGMSRFSIHSPETRGHIHEWVFQKALKDERLINLRYKFIKVFLNGKKLGIYALEEFFDKRLIENNQRREGIIFKPDRIINSIGGQSDFSYLYENSDTLKPYVYQKQKVFSDTILYNQYNNLSKQLHLFRKKKISAVSIIDIELSAKYLALSSIFGSQHGNIPENLIFYYNPITNLIEPIGYDGNVARAIDRYGGIITSPISAYHESTFIKDGVLTNLFDSEDFYISYIQQLKRMSEKDYINKLFTTIEKELQANLSILYKEYPYFDFFKRDFYSTNQNYIKRQLFDNKLVKADFIQYKDSNMVSLYVDNLKDIHIKVLGLVLDENMVYTTKNETIIKSTLLGEPQMVRFYESMSNELSLQSANELMLAYQILGIDSLFKVEVDQVPIDFFNKQKLSEKYYDRSSTIDQYSFLEKDYSTNTIIIHPGKYKIFGDLIIPKNHILTIKQGVELDLLNSGRIISHSPVRSLGTKKQPIIIHSTDSTGQGIVLLQVKKESTFKHVYFENLSNLSMDGWELTGSVNFYESNISITNCLFKNNLSEDALNIIRSIYKIDSTSFLNIKSDAFDGDFSNGTITNSSFINCGNDALDISGSIVSLNNIFIDGAGDKGISVGEKSYLKGNNINIINTEIGVACKDLSEIELTVLNMSNIKVGFTAFQKKSEFGPGNINITGLTSYDIELPFLIEEGSKMICDNKIVENVDMRVEEILYGVKYGKSSK